MFVDGLSLEFDWKQVSSGLQDSSQYSIIIIIIISFVFSLQHLLIVFHWSLGESKSSQVSRTVLSILVDLNNHVVWIISARPLISSSSSPQPSL